MINKPRLWAATLILTSGFSLPGGAATLYNEAVSGDLSNNGLAPTALPVSLGINDILGTTGRGASGTDRDYFTVSVPTGLQISQLVELAGTTVGGSISFIGVEAGSQVTLPTSSVTANGLLGWTHYGPISADADILPAMSIAALGSSGFTTPLPAGNYAFWIQDFDPGTFSYAFDIQLTQTPEPGTGILMLLTGIGVAGAFAVRHTRSSFER